MRSAVSPVASLMIITVFMICRYITHPRTFGIGRGGIAGHVRAHHLASASTQRVVLARRARLACIAPRAERTERIGSGPVRRELRDQRTMRRRRGEAAGGDPSIRLRTDQEITAGAAVDRELGEQRTIRLVMDDHRRVRAVDLDAHAMASRGGQHGRQKRAMLRVGAAQLAIRGGASARRLEPQQLDLRQPAPRRVAEDRVELVEVVARDHDVDPDLALDRTQLADRSVRAREPVEPAHRRVGGAEPVERDVDLAESIRDRHECIEAFEAGRS